MRPITSKRPTEIDARSLAAMFAEGHAPLLVDVRSGDEHRQGTIKNAILAPADDVVTNVAALEQHRANPIVLFCATGVRSARAARALVHRGYAQVSTLTGGLTSWTAAGFTLDSPCTDQLNDRSNTQKNQTHTATRSLEERYSRQINLQQLGTRGQARLADARVLVVGAGGLGSPVAYYLAAAGVGTIGIVDDDRVELSNLQRQIIHNESTVGQLKVLSAAARLGALNSSITVRPFPERLTTSNASELLGSFDLVVDGSDNIPTRYLINDTCVRLGIPFIYGALHHFDGQVAVFNDAGGPCYRCLYPTAPPPELTPSCAEAGVLGAVCGVVGSLQATAALRVLAGLAPGSPPTLLFIDALSMQVRNLTLTRDPNCPACGEGSRAS